MTFKSPMRAAKRLPDMPTPKRDRGAAALPEKKPRGRRVRLTHLEVKRGDALCLRIAVADGALAEIGDELGALVRKLAPNVATANVETTSTGNEFVISQQHMENDDNYHGAVRTHLTALIGALCDESLEDALRITREERARRSEGGN